MSAKVEKIIIKINEVEIALTPDEAKGLLNALQDLVGEKEVRIVKEIVENDYYPWRWYPYPYVTWQDTGTAPQQSTYTISWKGNTSPIVGSNGYD